VLAEVSAIAQIRTSSSTVTQLDGDHALHRHEAGQSEFAMTGWDSPFAQSRRRSPQPARARLAMTAQTTLTRRHAPLSAHQRAPELGLRRIRSDDQQPRWLAGL
jgi:hypothetical protein